MVLARCRTTLAAMLVLASNLAGRTLLIGIVLLCCSGCSRDPVENPNPTRVVRIFGAIDQSLSIKVMTLYVTRGIACAVRDDNLVVGWIEGGATPRSVWAASSLQKVGDVYQANVAMDRFVDDKCHWSPQAIGFQVSNQEGLTTGEVSRRFGYVVGPEPILTVTSPRLITDTSPRVIVGLEYEAERPHLTIECRRRHEGGEPGLKCTNKEPMNAVIGVDAREMQVDVYDLSRGAY